LTNNFSDAEATGSGNFKVWIKAVDLAHFDYPSSCAVAWAMKKPDEVYPTWHVTPRPDFPAGPLLRAIVDVACQIVRSVPKGTVIQFVSDFESFWKAFHPDHNWFAKWQEEGFVKKPAKDRDAWRELDRAMRETHVTISATPPIQPGPNDPMDSQAVQTFLHDARSLGELLKLARDAPNPETAPGDPIDDGVGWDRSTDWLYRRAIAKDD
jgi:hypothetical protein